MTIYELCYILERRLTGYVQISFPSPPHYNVKDALREQGCTGLFRPSGLPSLKLPVGIFKVTDRSLSGWVGKSRQKRGKVRQGTHETQQ
jgi:hypothetical protein